MLLHGNEPIEVLAILLGGGDDPWSAPGVEDLRYEDVGMALEDPAEQPLALRLELIVTPAPGRSERMASSMSGCRTLTAARSPPGRTAWCT